MTGPLREAAAAAGFSDDARNASWEQFQRVKLRKRWMSDEAGWLRDWQVWLSRERRPRTHTTEKAAGGQSADSRSALPAAPPPLALPPPAPPLEPPATRMSDEEVDRLRAGG
jgi:hypothetical protein